MLYKCEEVVLLSRLYLVAVCISTDTAITYALAQINSDIPFPMEAATLQVSGPTEPPALLFSGPELPSEASLTGKILTVP